MIFIAKNELGCPTWKLAQIGKKTVTRRLKPLSVGKEFAIQPGHGKFAICRAKVISCMSSLQHYHDYVELDKINEYEQKEANLEGFNSWDGLMQFFQKNKINFMQTYRIEYELIKNE